MTVPAFDATVRREAGLAILDLKGEINSFAEEKLKSAYSQAAGGQPAQIALNFKEVTYINSTGIALIVGLLAQARSAGQKLVVHSLTEHYLNIFKITRLSDFMSIYPDEASALSASAPPPLPTQES
jgi:anti-sigma B factor antagonist